MVMDGKWKILSNSHTPNLGLGKTLITDIDIQDIVIGVVEAFSREDTFSRSW